MTWLQPGARLWMTLRTRKRSTLGCSLGVGPVRCWESRMTGRTSINSLRMAGQTRDLSLAACEIIAVTTRAGRQLVAGGFENQAVKLRLWIIGVENSTLVVHRAQVRYVAVNHPRTKLLAYGITNSLMGR